MSTVDGRMGWGWCPIFKPDTTREDTKDFEVADYAGTWYEIKRDKDVWYEKDTTCVTATYTYNPKWWKPYPVRVNNRNTMSDDVGGEISSSDGRAWARCNKKGNCHVKFWWYPEGNYQVLDTDFNTYSLVYGCDNWFGIFHTNQAWILSRATTLSSSDVTTLTDLLKEKVKDKDYPVDEQWEDTVQGGSCNYPSDIV